MVARGLVHPSTTRVHEPSSKVAAGSKPILLTLVQPPIRQAPPGVLAAARKLDATDAVQPTMRWTQEPSFTSARLSWLRALASVQPAW